jgi:hypothetical protein
MYSYDTVVAAIDGLNSRGYGLNFNLAFDKITCLENENCLSPDEFEIVEVHRFEGDSNPEDEDVVYAIESKDGKLKGVLTSAFGTYADEVSKEILQKLKIHH